MNSVIVGLKSGNTIKLDNVNYQELLKNINEFKGNNALFITFEDVIFVIQNIEYIKKV